MIFFLNLYLIFITVEVYPLSPLLFIIVMWLLEQGREKNLLRGIITGNNRKQLEISHLFFADDIQIFCQPEIPMLLNLRCILLCFQTISELKINMYKFELVRIGKAGVGSSLARVMRCKSAQLPIKYLGLPLGTKYKDGRS